MGIGEGPQDGRPVGKTLYYSQSLEGHEFYPVNHISNFIVLKLLVEKMK